MKSGVSLGVARDRIVRAVASMAAALVAVTALIELTRAQPPAPKPTMLKMVDASRVTAVGGTGPMDAEWAKQPAWQPFNAAMLAASEAALAAIRAKDHDALLAASDALYPPCEGCHLVFNPGVVNQN